MVWSDRSSPLRALAVSALALGALRAPPASAQTCLPGFTTGPDTGLPAGAVVVAAPDLNRDGRPDLIFQADGGTGWALNQGGGRFAQAGFAAGLWGEIAVGDLDGDGVPDAVLVTRGSQPQISTYLGDGSGGFHLATSLPGPPYGGAWSPILADFDGDGSLDLAVETSTAASVWVYPGDGRGGLLPNASYFRPSALLTISLSAIHFPGARRSSLLVATGTLHGFLGSWSSYVSVGVEAWTMSGGGWSQDAVDILGSTGMLGLAVGDVDGDGLDDIVTVSPTPEVGVSRIDTYLDQPGGFILASRSLASGFQDLPHPIVADFDGDGRLDLVLFDTGYLSSRKFTLQLGDGAGGFGSPRTFTLPAPAPYLYLLAVDVDGDGRADLIASGIDGSPPLLLLGLCERLAPAEPGPGFSPRPQSPR